jgi:hypothetical protein
MIIRVFKSDLEHVVIDISNGSFGPDRFDPEGFKLKGGHRPGCVLQEGLIDDKGKGLPVHSLAWNKMRGNNLLRQTSTHIYPPLTLLRAPGIPRQAVQIVLSYGRKIPPFEEGLSVCNHLAFSKIEEALGKIQRSG